MSVFFKKTLSFLGLAEDESADYDDNYEEKSEIYQDNENSYRNDFNPRKKPQVANLARYQGILQRQPSSEKPQRRLLSLDGGRDSKKIRVSVSEPHEFEEIQVIGDDLKLNIPIILNLQNTNPELSKRIIDFCSGLTYALEGNIKKVADRVFLLTPKDTIVTSSEKELLHDRGMYNQL